MEQNGVDTGNRERLGGKKRKGSRISCADRDCGRGAADGLAVMDVKVGYSSPPAQTLASSHCHILTVSWCFNLNGFHSCQLSVIHHKIKQQSFKGTPALEKAGQRWVGRWEGRHSTGAHF